MLYFCEPWHHQWVWHPFLKQAAAAPSHSHAQTKANLHVRSHWPCVVRGSRQPCQCQMSGQTYMILIIQQSYSHTALVFLFKLVYIVGKCWESQWQSHLFPPLLIKETMAPAFFIFLPKDKKHKHDRRAGRQILQSLCRSRQACQTQRTKAGLVQRRRCHAHLTPLSSRPLVHESGASACTR